MARWLGSTHWKWRLASPLPYPQTKFGSFWQSPTTGSPEVWALADTTYYAFIVLLLFNHQDTHFENCLQELDEDAVFIYGKGAHNSVRHFSGCYFSSLCALLRHVDNCYSLMNPCRALPNRIMTLQINCTEENAYICQVVLLLYCFSPFTSCSVLEQHTLIYPHDDITKKQDSSNLSWNEHTVLKGTCKIHCPI